MLENNSFDFFDIHFVLPPEYTTFCVTDRNTKATITFFIKNSENPKNPTLKEITIDPDRIVFLQNSIIYRVNSEEIREKKSVGSPNKIIFEKIEVKLILSNNQKPLTITPYKVHGGSNGVKSAPNIIYILNQEIKPTQKNKTIISYNILISFVESLPESFLSLSGVDGDQVILSYQDSKGEKEIDITQRFFSEKGDGLFNAKSGGNLLINIKLTKEEAESIEGKKFELMAKNESRNLYLKFISGETEEKIFNSSSSATNAYSFNIKSTSVVHAQNSNNIGEVFLTIKEYYSKKASTSPEAKPTIDKTDVDNDSFTYKGDCSCNIL